MAASSQGEQPEIEVPTGDRTKTVSPRAPAGVHLLLLVAGVVGPDQGTARLQDCLGHGGPPPKEFPPHWASGLRGAGEGVPLGAELSSTCLKRLRGQMPRDFRAMYALFFQTAKPR